MNVKIKARVEILKSYMALMGFKDVQVYARIYTISGAPLNLRGKEEIGLEHLEEAARLYPGRIPATASINIKGHHTGLNNSLRVNREVPLEYIMDDSVGYLSHALREAEDALRAALYEQAKAKAVIRAADLL